MATNQKVGGSNPSWYAKKTTYPIGYVVFLRPMRVPRNHPPSRRLGIRFESLFFTFKLYPTGYVTVFASHEGTTKPSLQAPRLGIRFESLSSPFMRPMRVQRPPTLKFAREFENQVRIIRKLPCNLLTGFCLRQNLAVFTFSKQEISASFYQARVTALLSRKRHFFGSSLTDWARNEHTPHLYLVIQLLTKPIFSVIKNNPKYI